MNQGYTEPDPRIDLSGKDVMRKLLILMREAGIKAEFDQIQLNGFLPETLMQQPSIPDFLNQLKIAEPYFADLKAKAESEGKKLRVVASFQTEKSQVGLQAVPQGHPFYQLDGKDNVITIYSRYYDPLPLVIRGAGAGANVTASGIFSDVISIINS